ncbi:hypothetical protein MKW94_004066 [Papaver nudicaule]|uniref:Transmembrane protein n=1 Tax=Papaver nudicaule TaxID=74823 RepID=A0AA41VQK3_PAPNU|nr:hypothetical protein [Papaver nudicaule]
MQQQSLVLDSYFQSNLVFINNKNQISFQSRNLLIKKPRLVDFNFTSSSRSERFNAIVCARKRKGTIGLGKSGKTLIKSALQIATNLNFFPEPVNLILREGLRSNGGNGGGGFGGSWNGGGFDGWRKKKMNLGLLKYLFGVCVLVLLVVYRKESQGLSDLGIFGILGLFLLSVAERDWKRGIKSWGFGFCTCAFLMSLGFKRGEDLQKWVMKNFRTSSPVLEFVTGRRKRAWPRRRRAM